MKNKKSTGGRTHPGHGRSGLHRFARGARPGRTRLPAGRAGQPLLGSSRRPCCYGELIRGDVGDGELLGSILRRFAIRSVMHFAAFIQVGESVGQPLKYYENNSFNCLRLLKACLENGVENFIFSSTAAVYGMPEEGPGRRKGAAAAHQPLRRLQAGQRNDAARHRRRQPRLPLRRPALLQRRRRRPPGAAGPGLPPAHPPADPGAENRPGPVSRAWKCSAPTTPPPTARPSATTSTSTTWPAPTCWPWNF